MSNIPAKTARRMARTVGFLYLFIIVAGFFGQVVVRGSIVVPGDGAATAAQILASSNLWRWGVFGDVLMHLCDVPVMILLYVLFRCVHRPIALVALGFNLVQTCVLVANKLTLIAAAVFLDQPNLVTSWTPDQIHQTISFLVRLHDFGFALGLIFFATSCLLYGFLAYRSRYVPRAIAVGVSIAGASYAVTSVTLLLAPNSFSAVAPVLALSLLGELAFSLWLSIKAIKSTAWEALQSAERKVRS